MFRINIDTSKVLRLLDEVEEMMLGEVMQREIMNIIRSEWVPNIQSRLKVSMARSDYRKELDKTMVELIGERKAAKRKLPPRFYTMTELERRGPLAMMGASDIILEIVSAPTLVVNEDGIAGYIGDIDKLNAATQLTGNRYLWEILEYGTGIYAGKSPIIRFGFQVFFNRDKFDPDIKVVEMTVNNGQVGRHYFMDTYGRFYASEISSGIKLIGKLQEGIRFFNRGGR